ncbi:MAG: EF-hand domain-containing protein [Sphingomonas sp.]
MSGIVLMSLALAMGRVSDQSAPPVPLPPAPAASQVPDGREGSRLFISPMGEPFRADRDPQYIWFDRADTNHDGALSRDEFDKDAARWFAVLDRKHDGEIDPGDIEYYETYLAPEIRVDPYEGATASGGDDGDSSSTRPSSHPKLGAARYGYFDYPEPVMVADTNFNRGVDPREFQRAADTRFDLLDTNHDGKIERSELPKISALAGERTGKKGKRRR